MNIDCVLTEKRKRIEKHEKEIIFAQFSSIPSNIVL